MIEHGEPFRFPKEEVESLSRSSSLVTMYYDVMKNAEAASRRNGPGALYALSHVGCLVK